MGDDASERNLQGFSVAARRAVAVAGDEARALGHERLGTEHLLLGLLLDRDTRAGQALTAAGVTVAAVRKKVGEAVAAARARGSRPSSAALAFTARAERAIGRSSRFAHQQRSHTVEPEHLLLGVLDVEGTAGQVLRGLGVDVGAVRSSLTDGSGPSTLVDAVPATDTDRGSGAAEPLMAAAPLRCGSCGDALEEALAWRIVTAVGADEPRAARDALVFFCSTCGLAIGVSPA